jgi:hypothetical protein
MVVTYPPHTSCNGHDSVAKGLFVIMECVMGWFS